MTAEKNELIIPDNYRIALDVIETESAIKLIKNFFQKSFSEKLGLLRVTAPLFVRAGTGINDDLNGVEKPISFCLKNASNMKVEVVQSLAKWKRTALAKYRFKYPQGLYADMNAIRPDEILDNLHSIYVDQWDWEKIILQEERNLGFLKKTVGLIYSSIKETEEMICESYEHLDPILPDEIKFIHSEELLEMFPDKAPAERENAICRKHGAVFLIGIGAKLGGGEPHDGRAPDYDDWSTINNEKGYRGLNGDILIHYPLFDRALELSSMGIRVNGESLEHQLIETGETERAKLPFHKSLMTGELPLTIGGGIGQSRLCMVFLRKAHIGEIQAGIWPDSMIDKCKENGIVLL